jgi:hypothetical protein
MMSSKKNDTIPADELAIFKFDEELRSEVTQTQPQTATGCVGHRYWRDATLSRKADGVRCGCAMGRETSQKLDLQLGCKRT